MPVENIANALDEVATEELSNPEEKALNRAFERLLEDTRSLNTETVRRKKQEYMDEVMLGAKIARAQFNQNFGGGSTTAGKFTVSQIDPGYFGYQDWDNAPDATADNVDTWIDSSTPDELGGTAGEPIRVGEEAVHVIMGVATYENSPKTGKFKFEVNREPKTVIRCDEEFRNTDLKIKWLQSPYVIYEDTEFFAERYTPVAGTTSTRLVGLSFVEGKAARQLDPSTYTGTATSNNIVVEQ